jgi:hypothetical protein
MLLSLAPDSLSKSRSQLLLFRIVLVVVLRPRDRLRIEDQELLAARLSQFGLTGNVNQQGQS